MAKKIAVLITDEFEDAEFTSPADAFMQAGHKVVTIARQGGTQVRGLHGLATVVVDYGIDEVRVQQFDALLLPGGDSPQALSDDTRFVSFIGRFITSGKPVFAICRGLQLLARANAVRGRRLAAAAPLTQALEQAGAVIGYQPVVIDDERLVTSARPDDLEAFNRAALRLLG